MRIHHPIAISYLAKESLLFLAFCYLIIVGGTYNGTVLYSLQQINLLLSGAAGLAWLNWRIIRKRPFPATPLDIPIFIWLSVTAISCIVSTNPRLSLEYLNSQVTYVLAFYLIVDLVRAGWQEELWIKSLLLASLFAIGLGLLQITMWYLDWFEIGGWSQLIPPATMRVTSSLRHPNIYAAFLNLLLPLGLARLILTQKKFIRILSGLWAVVCLVLLYFTSSRGGWLGTAAVLAVFTFLVVLDNRPRIAVGWLWLKKRKFLLAILLLGICLFTILAVLMLARQANHPSHPQTSDPRSYIWKVAFDMFQRDPLTGLGPGTFGLSFIRHYSYPPAMLLAHAHNYILNTLAESGVTGVLSLGFLAVSLGTAMLKHWRCLPGGQRTFFAGLTAGLAGLTVHSQFDTPEIVIVINLITALLIGLFVAKMPSKPSRGIRNSGWGSFILLCSCLVTAVFSTWSLYGYSAFFRGLKASYSSNWDQASIWVNEAVRRDPSNLLYQFQQGFAYGELALNPDGSVRDQSSLIKAMSSYEKGLIREVDNSLHWANLAILRRADGDYAGSEKAMLKAVELAPRSAVLQLNLGRIYEETGKEDLAIEAYQKAIELQPAWMEKDYFQEGPLWKKALQNSTDATGTTSDGAWQLLDAGNFQMAEQVFKEQLIVNAADAYRGLGIALLGQDKFEEGERAIRTAGFIDGSPLQARLVLARYYKKLDYLELSEAELSLAQHLLELSSASGPGKLGEAQYAWYIYRRESIPPDLLPGWINNYYPKINR